MNQDSPEMYTDGAEVGDEDGNSVYHGVFLPDDAVENLDWERGDILFVGLSIEDADGNKIPRIEISKLPDGIPESHEQVYDLRLEDGKYFVRFPREWSSPTEGSPTFDVESGERLVLEVSEGSSLSLLVYRREDYAFRNAKLVEKDRPPLFRSFLAALGVIEKWDEESTTDLSDPYQGQKFRIIPYKSSERVAEDHSLQCRASEVEIYWSEESVPYWEEPDYRKMHTRLSTRTFEVILPYKSSFKFVSHTRHGTDSAEVNFRQDSDTGSNEYSGPKCEMDDGVVVVHLPCDMPVDSDELLP